jgi:transposase
MLPADLRVEPLPVAHLPVIRAIVDELQIRDVLDDVLPLDVRGRVSDGDCVTAMILNILEGRVALYSMEQWLARTDTRVLLGADCPAEAFNDARLAACLDHLHEAGTDDILTRVVTRYLRREDAPSEYTVHGDTTSIQLSGAYEGAGFPRPARGYSKDHRPDLLQLVFGMTLHGATGIPLTSAMFSGNTTDPIANRVHLDQLADLLPEEDDITVVGDCKLVDAQTLGQLLLHRFHFVSLLPATFNRREELVNSVRAMGPMPEIGHTKGRTKAEPDRVYRGKSFDHPYVVGLDSPGDNRTREVQLRYLVVESTQLAEQEEAALDRRLERERTKFAEALGEAARRTYACVADAELARERLTRKLEYHTAHVDVVSETVTLPRGKRGRPPAGEPAPTAEVFRLVEAKPLEPITEAIETLRFHARHFVLVTDHLDREKWPDARILAEYRHQHVIEGHTGFRWLKTVAQVAPVFLHTPERIAALGLVFVLALMVRNYLQFTLRRRLVETGETVPDRLGKPYQKPTTETALIPFATVTVNRIFLGDQLAKLQVTGLDKHAYTVLRMLRIDESVFFTSRTRKMTEAARETPGM